jgi:hypothetical protein
VTQQSLIAFLLPITKKFYIHITVALITSGNEKIISGVAAVIFSCSKWTKDFSKGD